VATRSEVPYALRQAAETISATRGRALQLRRVLDRSLIPMLMVDNDRRYTEVNAAARLVFRMSFRDLREQRIDDLTANWPLMISGWQQLMERGEVSGRYLLRFKDDSRLWVFYAALANALPGRHLIVFIPADWPGDELEEMEPASADGTEVSLSERQLDVLRLVAVGANASQIAAELSITEATVRTHVKNILARLGANNRAHAVALAMTQGLLAEPSSLSPADTRPHGA